MITNAPLALSVGEPAGVGPDIVLQAHLAEPNLPIVVFASINVLRERAHQLKIDVDFIDHNAPDNTPGLRVVNIDTTQPVVPGILNPANANYVLHALQAATQACLQKKMAALITGPVNKAVLNRSDIIFSGHTEWLAEYTNSKCNPVMMFVQKGRKVALLTTHLPLSEVPKAVTAKRLTECITTLHHDIQRYFGYTPNIKVCGLNPHAGENGYLGTEEQTLIMPTLAKLTAQGINISGPISADTAFLPQHIKPNDVILAMYHDQALPVIKTLDFHHTVNVTLGLPILRTSVDHGTALALAGTGEASPASLLAAIKLAQQLRN